MMQKNLMKTVYLVFLALSGTSWPWISANAQDYTVLTVTAPFNLRQPDLVCSTSFQCVDQNGNPHDCAFGCPSANGCDSNTRITVKLQSITCTRGQFQCIDVPSGQTATYNPSQNALVASVNFADGRCHCSPITFTTTPALAPGYYNSTATSCTGTPPIFPNRATTNGAYIITGVQYTGTGN